MKPEVEQFIKDLVGSGSFTSREAVVESAIIEMMRRSAEAELDDDDDAIKVAEDEINRGEIVDFGQFAADTRRSAVPVEYAFPRSSQPTATSFASAGK